MQFNKKSKSDTSNSNSGSNKTIISSSNSQNISKRVPFTVVEAYKTIRTNLLFLLGNSSNKVIAFSSPNAGEGKSTTAINVAVAFAQLGGKILLIDADMRRPTIYRRLHLDNTVGLSNVIAGFCEFSEAVKPINNNLDVLTSGSTPPNPSEMLSSAEFDKLLESVKEKYDYIILDTPPINVVSDALVIAPKTAGLALIVRSGFTPFDSFERAVEAAKFANVNILGTIMNGSYESRGRYYKYKKYGRYRRYGRYGRYGRSRGYYAYNYKYSRSKSKK